MKDILKLSYANELSVVKVKNARFTVLTQKLIRMEFSETEIFEDRPTQVFWYRNQAVPKFTYDIRDNVLKIDTQYLCLSYKINESGFCAESLKITLKETGKAWHFGDLNRGNLLGTARTLDNIDGSVPLDNGLISKEGWSIVDDTKKLIFDDDGMLKSRTEFYNLENYKDIYFFGYADNYLECIKDYYKIAGGVPILPKWALGNWWSRYWEYSQQELSDLMLEFEKREVPISVCIIDMDWHIVENPYNGGWTGYTWNKKFFPQPEKLIEFLHNKDIKTALNLHPADGVYPHEDCYEEMANFMGIDPKTNEKVEFDISDNKFIEGYFKYLHHPHENIGVDFWWLDWQQGSKTKVDGLDPLWALNHLHFYDLGRTKQKRPFIFSRWGGLGNHRYPIGFSGDTIVSWDSLRFQPYFTATASNVGYSWWSHDVGGHFRGMEDKELYTRWVQFGIFSPIMRLHSSKFDFISRAPWAFDDNTFMAVRNAMQLRHALIPYIYTMSWLNSTLGIPFILPMYYYSPKNENAYNFNDQYYYGTEMLVAPFVSEIDEEIGMARKVVWLPEGEWFDFNSGERYAGDKKYAIYGGIGDIPVFAKAGAIIPLAQKDGKNKIDNPISFEIVLFPGSNNCFELYEDDGETQLYKEGMYAITKLENIQGDKVIEFIINKVKGDVSVIPSSRRYSIKYKGINKPDRITISIDRQKENRIDFDYDAINETVILEEIIMSPIQMASIRIYFTDEEKMGSVDRKKEKLEKLLWSMKLPAATKGLINYLALINFDNLFKSIAELEQSIGFPVHTLSNLYGHLPKKGNHTCVSNYLKTSQIIAIYETINKKEISSEKSFL